MAKATTVDERLLDEAVRRIVKAVQPRRIVLFGSAARGQMGPNSDIDLLIVVRNGTHRRHTAQALYRKLMGVGFAMELVVATESDLRDFANEPSFVYGDALREGKELYRAA